MSEPWSLYLRCRLEPAELRKALASKGLLASAYDDWNQLPVEMESSWIGIADHVQQRSAGEYLADTRDNGGGGPQGWRFSYDGGELVVAAAYWSENWIHTLAGLAMLRRWGHFCRDDGGFLVGHDAVFGREDASFGMHLQEAGRFESDGATLSLWTRECEETVDRMIGREGEPLVQVDVLDDYLGQT